MSVLQAPQLLETLTCQLAQLQLHPRKHQDLLEPLKLALHDFKILLEVSDEGFEPKGIRTNAFDEHALQVKDTDLSKAGTYSIFPLGGNADSQNGPQGY